jgi:hypothetical protein
MSEAEHTIQWQVMYFARALNCNITVLESLFQNARAAFHMPIIRAKLDDLVSDRQYLVITTSSLGVYNILWPSYHQFVTEWIDTIYVNFFDFSGVCCTVRDGYFHFATDSEHMDPVYPEECWIRLKKLVDDEDRHLSPEVRATKINYY